MSYEAIIDLCIIKESYSTLDQDSENIFLKKINLNTKH